MSDVFIEHVPEHFHGGNIYITIHVKPSLMYVAEDMKHKLEREIAVYNRERNESNKTEFYNGERNESDKIEL